MYWSDDLDIYYLMFFFLPLQIVAAGNRGVPDDLQKCHAMSKQLQLNQTDINQRLTVYDGQIANITQQVSVFLWFGGVWLLLPLLIIDIL